MEFLAPGDNNGCRKRRRHEDITLQKLSVIGAFHWFNEQYILIRPATSIGPQSARAKTVIALHSSMTKQKEHTKIVDQEKIEDRQEHWDGALNIISEAHRISRTASYVLIRTSIKANDIKGVKE